MYLQYYALVFFILTIYDSKNKFTWALLFILCLLLKLNLVIFGVTDIYRYINRTSIIFISAVILLLNKSKTSCYQSFILLIFLAINELMLYSPNNNNYFYRNFEILIYGLVYSQFIAIIPKIWFDFNNFYTNSNSGIKNKRLVNKI